MSKTQTKPTAEVSPDLDVPVIVALSQIAELLPTRAPQTIYRWRMPRNGHDPVLPAPFAICARTPLYRLETVLDVAEKMAVPVDEKVLKRIRAAQGR